MPVSNKFAGMTSLIVVGAAATINGVYFAYFDWSKFLELRFVEYVNAIAVLLIGVVVARMSFAMSQEDGARIKQKELFLALCDEVLMLFDEHERSVEAVFEGVSSEEHSFLLMGLRRINNKIDAITKLGGILGLELSKDQGIKAAFLEYKEHLTGDGYAPTRELSLTKDERRSIRRLWDRLHTELDELRLLIFKAV